MKLDARYELLIPQARAKARLRAAASQNNNNKKKTPAVVSSSGLLDDLLGDGQEGEPLLHGGAVDERARMRKAAKKRPRPQTQLGFPEHNKDTSSRAKTKKVRRSPGEDATASWSPRHSKNRGGADSANKAHRGGLATTARETGSRQNTPKSSSKKKKRGSETPKSSSKKKRGGNKNKKRKREEPTGKQTKPSDSDAMR